MVFIVVDPTLYSLTWIGHESLKSVCGLKEVYCEILY